MEQYLVVGKRDGRAVLERFEYAPGPKGQLVLILNPLAWRQHGQSTAAGRLLVELSRNADGALFTVPVYRSLAQLRARSRVTRGPRRLYREDAQEGTLQAPGGAGLSRS